MKLIKDITKIKKFESLISNKKHVLIVSHFNPDGDAVGSVVGLYYYLRDLNIDVNIILPSTFPQNVSFLDIKEGIIIYEKDIDKSKEIINKTDLLFCLDCYSLSRTGAMSDLLLNLDCSKIIIDHHLYPSENEFDLVISNIKASSACELLFYLLMDTEKVNSDVMNINIKGALALAVGLLTDTNNFSNSTTELTYNMASLLTKRGVDLMRLNETLFKSNPIRKLKLMGEMLSAQLVIMEEEQAAYMILTKEIKEKFGFMPGDAEGFVNLPLTLEEVRISAFFTESDDYVRVSLRCKSGISVNDLSKKYFNGGGHAKAAGGRLDMKIEQVPKYFEKSLKEFLKEKQD